MAHNPPQGAPAALIMTDSNTTPAKLTFPDTFNGVIVESLPDEQSIKANINGLSDPARWRRLRRAKELGLTLERYTALLMAGAFRQIAAEKTRQVKNGSRRPQAPEVRRRRRNGEVKPEPRKIKPGTGVYPTSPINPMETGYLNPSYFDKFRRR